MLNVHTIKAIIKSKHENGVLNDVILVIQKKMSVVIDNVM